jgi:hypothetical protein
MANPTTNYGFVLPTSSDLVTDLPADFDVALQGVDTRLKALQPGTTLGDLVYSSATANTNTRLGIGTTGQVLTVAGGVPSWATAAAGGMTLLSTTSLTTATTNITSISQSYTNLMIEIEGISIPTAQRLNVQLRNSTNAQTVYAAGANQTSATTYNGLSTIDVFNANITATDTRNVVVIQIDNYAVATRHGVQIYGSTNNGGSYCLLGGAIDNTIAINAVQVALTATPTAGTVKIWGIK